MLEVSSFQGVEYVRLRINNVQLYALTVQLRSQLPQALKYGVVHVINRREIQLHVTHCGLLLCVQHEVSHILGTYECNPD